MYWLHSSQIAKENVLKCVNLNLSLCENHSSMVILKCIRLFKGCAESWWLMFRDSLFMYSSFFMLISYANLCCLNQLLFFLVEVVVGWH